MAITVVQNTDFNALKIMSWMIICSVNVEETHRSLGGCATFSS
jgi:hypothetical protein